MKRFPSLATLAVLVSAQVFGGFALRSADADVINFKAGGRPSNITTGSLAVQGAYSDPGNNYWNFYGSNANVTDNGIFGGSLSYTDLLTSGSTSSTVDFTLGVPSGQHGGPTPSPANVINNTFIRYNPTPSATFTISGLDLAKTYDLYLYGIGDQDTGGMAFSVTDASTTVSGSTTGWNGGFGSGTGPYQLGVSYVVFSGLTPKGDSTITGTLNAVGIGGSAGGFNGFQLVAVPEPSTLAGLGVIGAGLAAVIRRRLRAAKSAS